MRDCQPTHLATANRKGSPVARLFVLSWLPSRSIRRPKMKKLFSLFTIIMLLLLLTACGTQGVAQSVIELPSPIQLAILTGVTFVVGFIFTKIAEAVPFLKDFLGQYVDEVSVAVAGAVVLSIQNLLNAIPPEWEGV